MVSHPLLITYLVFVLRHPDLKLRSLVSDVLAAITVLGGLPLILSAFSEFRVAFEETFRFETLVHQLGIDQQPDLPEGRDSELALAEDWKVSGMALVNALCQSSNELEERVMLRDEFSRRGLNEVMVVSLFSVLFFLFVEERRTVRVTGPFWVLVLIRR